MVELSQEGVNARGDLGEKSPISSGKGWEHSSSRTIRGGGSAVVTISDSRVPDPEKSDDCHVAIGLGSNLGDRAQNLAEAIARLAEGAVRDLRVSSIVESPPLGPPQPHYLNQVVVGVTSLEPLALLQRTQEIERALGRESGGPRWGPRPIDLDILAMGGLSPTTDELILPHPACTERRFVLIPWCELEPDFVLPGAEGWTLRRWLEELGEPTETDRVWPWREGPL